MAALSVIVRADESIFWFESADKYLFSIRQNTFLKQKEIRMWCGRFESDKND